ncbi:DNA-binding protein [Aquihabitans daechungensis]|uniref:DNA-binding protein n=1 Tax=Aquihabitans daechungensis TaxID=1052257 RepID=UPI003BA1DB1E
MGRKVDVDDLVGATEIGQRLGIDRRSVHQLRRRHDDFPDPVATLESAMVWAWRDVERWAKATGRLIP